MTLSQIIEKLEILQLTHGNVYLSVRHTAEHAFSPEDDLTRITDIKYNPDTNLATLYVNN